jgi:NAD+ synthase
MFSRTALDLNPTTEVARIVSAIREHVLVALRKRGAVVGLSGGVDSSVVAALCARALGRDKVLALLMPERDSADESLALGRQVAENLGIEVLVEDIRSVLESAGCYRRQAEAIRQIIPSYEEGWRCKLVLPSILESERLNVSRLTVADPLGNVQTVRLTAAVYRALIAATNFKQRVRKMIEYYHADRLNFAVAGTPNRLEYDQGFFVKQGDGAADFKPIAHLYKTQVYELARFLNVPPEVTSRPPTTDTFSLPQTQEEFYFALPYDRMDLCLWAYNRKIPPSDTAEVVGLTTEQVQRVFRDIEGKRRATQYQHAPPLLVEPVRELCS